MKSFEVEPADESRLNQLLSSMSDPRRPLTVDRLVAKWSRFLDELERGYDLSVYDYTNDLEGRARLEDVLAVLSPTSRDRLKNLLEPLDDRFANQTESAPFLWGGPRVRWLQRVPKRPGPELAGDLADMRAKAHQKGGHEGVAKVEGE
jgi:hypothetical protein